jgi:hypothetical protein
MSTLNVDKVDPSTGTALEIGSSGDTATVPSGATLAVAGTLNPSGTITAGTIAGTALANTTVTFDKTSGVVRPNAKPLIINGAMQVRQRSEAATGITSSGYYALDRWKVENTNGGTWTMYYNVGALAHQYGFPQSLWMDNTTADASLGAADNLKIIQRIEAQDCQLLKFGYADAETLTLGFWAYSTKTGTYIAELYQTDDDRSCSQSYTIDVTNTWEYKVLNFPADTTGVIDVNDGTGLTVLFWMAAGTNFTSGTLNETWGATTAANRAVGQVNAADSTSNNFQLTGVQLEIGTYTSTTMPPFQHETYAESRHRCFRYYQRHPQLLDTTTDGFIGQGWTTSTAYAASDVQLYVPMRVVPAVAVLGALKWRHEATSTADSSILLATNQSSKNIAGLYDNLGSGLTIGNGISLLRDADADAGMTFDSEL